MRVRRAAIVAAVIAVGATGLSACSSSGGSSGGANSTGPITLVCGKDNSNVWPHVISEWNSQHPNEKVTLKQQSDQADQQLSDLQQHFQAKDAGYDAVCVDVVWTAEFAA